MHKGNTALKIVSLLIAVAMWLYVMGEVDPETKAKIGDIPVSLSNTEVLADYGMAAAYDEQITINATVSGKRSDVNEAKKNGLTAYVDVSECELGDNEEKIVINLPSGVSLESSSQSVMNVKVEYITRASVPVVMEFAEDMSSSGDSAVQEVPWVIGYYPEKVTVWGAESSVAKVKEVKGIIDPQQASTKQSEWVEVDLKPVNGKGREIKGIELNNDSASAEIRLLSTKAVELNLVAAHGEKINVDEIDAPDSIMIAGIKDALADINSAEGTVSADENGKISIHVELPDNMYLLIGEDNGKIIWN